MELLSAARDKAVGRAAIEAGADALYIGASLFSARSSAGNSLEDIAELCSYAHSFGVRVYLALNTLLKVSELPTAKKLALEAVEAGVDAIIFQDVRILDMELPVALHASTQCAISSVSQALEFQRAGVTRIVVERGLSIAEIRAICSAVDVEVEAFVHGAICVGYSGVCYLSEKITGRSGNRGECAQPCRSNYDLLDAAGKVVLMNEPLLSPRDLNLSQRLVELKQAGVTSFKIEGRLKDESYITNVVSYYNAEMNRLGMERDSWGKSQMIDFTANPAQSFNRGFTEWFFDGVDSSKRGALPSAEYVGEVQSLDKRTARVKLERGITIENGDGLSYFSAKNQRGGTRVNRAEGGLLHLWDSAGLEEGMKLYRNFTAKSRMQTLRKISIDICVGDGRLVAKDDYGHSAELSFEVTEVASNRERAESLLRDGLSKSGGTIFSVREVRVECQKMPHLRMAMVNELRRELFKRLMGEMTLPKMEYNPTSSRGVENITPEWLMRSRHCILREYGLCLKQNKGIRMPLSLYNNGVRLALEFDCGECQMYIKEHCSL
ncbi:MAG: U32 family peptidase [Rikenellaceae bacterium]